MEEPINYRTVGTKALNRGKIVTSKSGHQASAGPVSIPSKVETILYKGDRENKAFGSQALRFQEPHPDLAGNSGPGTYSLPSTINQYMSQPSWGKRGTGGFASVSKRFVPKGFRCTPGPGTYVVPTPIGQEANSQVPSANFCQHESRNPLKRSHIVPGPGQYELRNDVGAPRNKFANGTSNFTSCSRRMKEKIIQGPGPGQYKLTPDPVAPSDVPSRNFSRPTEKKLFSNCPAIVNPPPLEHADKNEEFVKTARGQTRGDMPGPGTYTLKSTLLPQAPDAKKKTHVVVERSQLEKAEHIKEAKRNMQPGPGQYDPKVEYTRQAVKTVSLASSSLRNKHEAKKAPGPAYYDVKPKALKSFHLNLKGGWI